MSPRYTEEDSCTLVGRRVAWRSFPVFQWPQLYTGDRYRDMFFFDFRNSKDQLRLRGQGYHRAAFGTAENQEMNVVTGVMSTLAT